jgi:hypothetical protein
MAKEKSSTRSKAGKKAAASRVRAARAEGKKSIKLFGKRVPLSEFNAQGKRSKKAAAAISKRGKLPARPKLSAALTKGAKKRVKTEKARREAQGRALKKASSRARRASVAAGMTSTPEKKEETTMAAKTKAGKKAARTRARNKKKKEEAAKKGARTRARKKGHAKKHTKRAKAHTKKRAHTKRAKTTAHRSKRRKGSKRKTGRKGHGAKVMAIPKGATKVIAAERRRGRRHHRGHRRNHYSMENPLSGMEIFAGGLTMLLGLAVADISDRYWATHALTAGAANAQGVVTYTDTPAVTSSTGMAAVGTGLYPNMKNGAAVMAPMNLTRWLSGGALAVVPFVAAAFTKNNTARTAFQFFGFGVVARIGGKFLVDTFASLLGGTQYGQQLYVNELAATGQYQAAMGNPVTVTLPGGVTPTAAGDSASATGLSKPHQAGPGERACCGNCAQGLPCSKEIAPNPPTTTTIPTGTVYTNVPVDSSPGTDGGLGRSPRQLGAYQPRPNPFDWSRHITEAPVTRH